MIFEKNLAIMTISITLAFIVRSSSLVGWIPIALATMYNSSSYLCIFYNLLVMIQAGILITIPMCIFSVAIDSIYYGKLMIPQYNFLHANIVQDLASGFGKEPMDYYLVEVR